MTRPAFLIGSEWLPNRAGGLNRYFHGLCEALAAREVPAHGLVTYLHKDQCGPIPLRCMAGDDAGLLSRLGGARTVARDAFEQGVALANPHFALYAWPWLRELPHDVPLIVNFHGPWADEMAAEHRGVRVRLKAAAARAIERRVYAQATRCIALSKAFADVLSGRYEVPRGRVAVVPGGVRLERFLSAPARQDARTRLGWPDDRYIVLCVRRLARRMGIDVLIEAAARARTVIRNLLVLIAGTGHASEILKSQVARAGLDDTVRFLGFVPDADLPMAYAASDLTVVPSVALEGFGLVIVESLASGTPAIATPVGGMPEVLCGIPDLLTEAATSESLAQSMCRALACPGSLPSTDECRRYAARFGWDAVLPEILGVWRESGAVIGSAS